MTEEEKRDLLGRIQLALMEHNEFKLAEEVAKLRDPN